MSENPRATGVIVPVKVHLTMLATQMDRWQAGDVPDGDMATLIDRVARQVARSCHCDAGRCCEPHQEHTSPHLGCVLR